MRAVNINVRNGGFQRWNVHLALQFWESMASNIVFGHFLRLPGTGKLNGFPVWAAVHAKAS